MMPVGDPPRTAQGDRHDALDLPKPAGYPSGQLYLCLRHAGLPEITAGLDETKDILIVWISSTNPAPRA
jgi:hypothetical protein